MVQSPTLKYFIFIFIGFAACNGYSQEIFLNKNEIKNHRISGIVTHAFSVSGEKEKKQYTDTLKFDKDGNLVEKRITVYDTSLISTLSGIWKYTYDSLGNLRGETRKSPRYNIMDYNNLVYDSSRIIKRIWVYWINMKHQFDRIYEYNYGKTGSHLLQSVIVEDGTEKVDSVYFYEYDGKNQLTFIWGSSDAKGKDTTFTISYSYNQNDLVNKIVGTRFKERKAVEYFYDTYNKLIEEKSGFQTQKYEYDKEGLIINVKQYKNQAKLPLKIFRFSYVFCQIH